MPQITTVKSCKRFLSPRTFRKLLAALLLLAVQAQGALAFQASTEQRTASYFDSIKKQPLLVAAFLREMPKGADLHNHLSGAIYAESFIEWAAEDKLCVNRRTFVLSNPPCEDDDGRVAVSQAFVDPLLYRQIIDAWSMRNWELSGQSGHDRFFDMFGKFGLVTGKRVGDMLAEETARAAYDRLSYVELMLTPDGGKVSQLGRQLGAEVDWEKPDFNQVRQTLLAKGLNDAINDGRKALDEAEGRRRDVLNCDRAQPDAGCKVEVRYLYQVARGGLPEAVFAQILAGFEMASVDPRVVGINLVQPEDWYIPMRDFALHMRMIQFLRPLYPKVRVSLHAGELRPGIVPPEGLRFHIRQSVEIARAERIGHGVGIMWEDNPLALIKDMAARNVLVEICLTSNDVILGVRGIQHPLALYLKYGVPVALATDDLGISRSDMTGEYVRAAIDQELDYTQLKRMARASLEYSFAGGASLWQDSKRLIMTKQCSADELRAARRLPTPASNF